MSESFREYCLRADRENLLSEWDAAKNAPLTPDGLTAKSSRRVWWRCDNGHTWRNTVAARTEYSGGCPVCSGRRVIPGVNDLATTHPALAREWAEDNGSFTPRDVAASATRRILWKCGEGHVWRATVAARASGAACPYCAGRRVWKPQDAPAPTPIRAAQPAREDRPAV